MSQSKATEFLTESIKSSIISDILSELQETRDKLNSIEMKLQKLASLRVDVGVETYTRTLEMFRTSLMIKLVEFDPTADASAAFGLYIEAHNSFVPNESGNLEPAMIKVISDEIKAGNVSKDVNVEGSGIYSVFAAPINNVAALPKDTATEAEVPLDVVKFENCIGYTHIGSYTKDSDRPFFIKTKYKRQLSKENREKLESIIAEALPETDEDRIPVYVINSCLKEKS